MPQQYTTNNQQILYTGTHVPLFCSIIITKSKLGCILMIKEMITAKLKVVLSNGRKSQTSISSKCIGQARLYFKYFEGISIFVNGYTGDPSYSSLKMEDNEIKADPPAAELRKLICLHGGEFHIYYKYGTTTYTIATHLAVAKVKKLRKEEKVIHPKWLLDSIEAGTRLREDDYLLYKMVHCKQLSRLHLISTLAQEMKYYVNELRENQTDNFPSRIYLQHLVDESFTDSPKETICHIDLDCFFVSVALRTRPELIGKPVAITHSRGIEGAGMSEIASCSYEARAQGVRNGCLIKNARETCPELICLPYQFDDYRHISREIYSILSGYTLNIRAVSCDEMYVDLESLCKEMHITSVMEIISIIRSEILTKTGCNASVGIGNTMLAARIATRHAKPNGQFMIKVNNIDEVIKKEKISSLPGIGHNICAKLRNEFGEMNLCEDLQKVPISRLRNLLGEKIGTQEDEVMDFLGKICSELEKKLHMARMTASTITLKLLIRAHDAPVITEKYLGYGKCDAVTRTAHVPCATANKAVLHVEAKKLMKAINPAICDLRGKYVDSIFAVRSRGQQHVAEKNKPKNEDDIALELALKKSIKESTRNLRHRKETIHPDYRNYFEDEDVKAEFLRILEQCEYPTVEVVTEMATYFGLLLKNGDLSDVLSQLRFLQREIMNFSLEWIIVVCALKVALNRLCDTSTDKLIVQRKLTCNVESSATLTCDMESLTTAAFDFYFQKPK
ncbi:ImpB/MucB/SamB family protein [Dirofilaria immitis]|nr:ImpB/MucB/SamB family protein [Dirofilaria immitis]